MNNNLKRIYIAIAILILIALIIVYFIYNDEISEENKGTNNTIKYSQSNNVTVEENGNESIVTDFLEKYSQASNTVVANFAGENITEKI